MVIFCNQEGPVHYLPSIEEIFMAVKAFVCVEVVKGERVYSFSIPVGAPYGEAYDAVAEAKATVFDLLQKSQEADKEKESSEAPTEVSVEAVN
jgi:hypothetical protein